jgi:CheY-like chemotaxis protein
VPLTGTPPEKPPHRILIVEDNAINQKVIAMYVKKRGFATEIAANGLEAVNNVKSKPLGYFDLILLDIFMPEMDGFEACVEIRKWEGGKHHYPIVALTANVMQEIADQCTECGMDECLSKPIDYKKLDALLEKYVINRSR